jgi:hypothetical protein
MPRLHICLGSAMYYPGEVSFAEVVYAIGYKELAARLQPRLTVQPVRKNQ